MKIKIFFGIQLIQIDIYIILNIFTMQINLSSLIIITGYKARIFYKSLKALEINFTNKELFFSNFMSKILFIS